MFRFYSGDWQYVIYVCQCSLFVHSAIVSPCVVQWGHLLLFCVHSISPSTDLLLLLVNSLLISGRNEIIGLQILSVQIKWPHVDLSDGTVPLSNTTIRRCKQLIASNNTPLPAWRRRKVNSLFGQTYSKKDSLENDSCTIFGRTTSNA